MKRKRIGAGAGDTPRVETPAHTLGSFAKGKPIRRYTKVETREHLIDVEDMIVRYFAERQIVEAMRKKWGTGIGRTRQLMKRVYDKWAIEDAEKQPQYKAQQLRAVEMHIRRAMGRRDKTGKIIEKPNESAIARYEELQARIKGTEAPIRIDITAVVAQALVPVIGNLTNEQIERAMREQEELEELAAIGRKVIEAKPAELNGRSVQ
ncbi:MAG: hypothetical protein PVSMB8_00650 [Vulcanimicrobiaceae bacterium]